MRTLPILLLLSACNGLDSKIDPISGPSDGDGTPAGEEGASHDISSDTGGETSDTAASGDTGASSETADTSGSEPDSGTSTDTAASGDTGDGDTSGSTTPSCDDVGSSLDAPDETPCTDGVAAWIESDGSTFSTVQLALDAAALGDTVTVCPGTWTEELTAPDGTAGDLTLRGYGPTRSILSGGGAHTVLTAPSGSALTLRGLAIEDGSAPETPMSEGDGGGIAFSGTSLILDGVLLEGNSSGYDGGGLFAGGESVQINDTCFRDNHSGYEGAGARVYAPSALTITDSFFVANDAEYGGGAVKYGGWTDGPGVVIMGSTFQENTAGNGGGAITIGDWEFTDVSITDSVFDQNTSGDEGGAIEAGSWGGATLTIQDTTLSNNHSDYDGGGLDLGGWGVQTAHLTDVWITGNDSRSGAAVNFGSVGTPTLTMSGGGVTGNTAMGEGGGIELSAAGSLDVSDVDFGDGATDNAPDDVTSVSGYDADASFSCAGWTCTPAP